MPKRPLHIRELSADAIPSIYPLIKLQNPWMRPAQFASFLADMLPNGYHAVGVFRGEELITCGGFWLRARFWCGKQLDIDNVIVHPDFRRLGIGKKLMHWFEEKALQEGCHLMVLDSYTTTAATHRFYFNEGFALNAYHFTKIPGSREIGKLPHKTS